MLALMLRRSPPTTTITPTKPKRAASFTLGPMRSPKKGAAKNSAIMGAIKVSPIACASGIRVRPKKNKYIITAVKADRPTCNLKAALLGFSGRKGRYSVAAKRAPMAFRQNIALKVPMARACAFMTASITEKRKTPARASAIGRK